MLGICGAEDSHPAGSLSKPGCEHSTTMPIDLSQFETEDLMVEIQRRLDCLKKPEKRVVLIGDTNKQVSCPFHACQSASCVFSEMWAVACWGQKEGGCNMEHSG